MSRAWRSRLRRGFGCMVASPSTPPRDKRRPDLRTARVSIIATWPGRGGAANAKLATDVQFPITVGSDGSFDLANLPPATYSFTCTLPSSASERGAGGPADQRRGWWLRSATVDGKDILDEPYTLDASPTLPTVVLTLTDRHSSLSGAFQDATGRATSAITVLVFPTNPAWWGETSRRVRIQRPGTDGKYTFVDLPAGDYLLAAVTDMEPDAWKDPAFPAFTRRRRRPGHDRRRRAEDTGFEDRHGDDCRRRNACAACEALETPARRQTARMSSDWSGGARRIPRSSLSTKSAISRSAARVRCSSFN